MLKKKKNILHLANNLTGKSDGVYNHIKLLADLTENSNYTHFLYCPGNEQIINNLENSSIYFINWRKLNKVKFSFVFFLSLLKVIIKYKIDIIQCHTIKPYIIAGIINIFLNKKLIYNFHGSFIEHDSYSKIEKYLYKTGHYFINLLNAASVCVVPFNVNKERILIETKLFKEVKSYSVCSRDSKSHSNTKLDKVLIQLDTTKKILISIGRLDTNKNFSLGIRIFSELKKLRSDMYYFIIGDGDLQNELNSLIKVLKLDSVIFIDYVENIQNYFYNFDALLITSKREGLPTVLLEAMKEGLPFFSTNVGIAEMIVKNDCCGKLIDGDDIKYSANLINESLNDLKIMRELSERGKYAMSTKYTQENFISFFTEIYSD